MFLYEETFYIINFTISNAKFISNINKCMSMKKLEMN